MSNYKYNGTSQRQGVSAQYHGEWNPFEPQQNYVKSVPAFLSEEEFTANTANFAYGQKTIIQIDKRFVWGGELYLQYERDAVLGPVGNKFTFEDYEPLGSISKVEYVYNNKVFYTQLPDHHLFHIINKTTDKEYVTWLNRLQGEKTLAERRVNTDKKMLFKFPLLCPWRKLNKMLPMIGIPNKIEVHIYFKNLYECGFLQAANPLGHTCKITDVRIIQEGVLTEAKEKMRVWDLATTGISYKITDHEEHRKEVIPTGTSTFKLKIRNIKNDAYLMYFTLRPVTSVDSMTARDQFNFRLCKSYCMEDSGKEMFKPIETQDFVDHFYADCFPNVHWPSPYHLIPFCPRNLIEASDDQAMGSRAMVHYSNPELVIKFEQPTTQEMYLDLVAMIHQHFFIKKGDLRVLLAV